MKFIILPFIPLIISLNSFSQGEATITPLYKDTLGLVIWENFSEVDKNKIHVSFDCESWNDSINFIVNDTTFSVKDKIKKAFYIRMNLHIGSNIVNVTTYTNDGKYFSTNSMTVMRPVTLQRADSRPEILKSTRKKIIFNQTYTYKICYQSSDMYFNQWSSTDVSTGNEIDLDFLPKGQWKLSIRETGSVYHFIKTKD